MAENTEFIAAKDLPVTEVEEVDVLCVDPATGELVKKSGANLGGSGGGITILEGSTTDGESTTLDLSTLTINGNTPTAQEIYNAFVSGGVVLRMNSISGAKFVMGHIICVKPYADYIKCYYFGEYGTISNFDYDGEIVEQ